MVDLLNIILPIFFNVLIGYFTRNGQVDPDTVFEQPYISFQESGVAVIFPPQADKFINIVRETNGNAWPGLRLKKKTRSLLTRFCRNDRI